MAHAHAQRNVVEKERFDDVVVSVVVVVISLSLFLVCIFRMKMMDGLIYFRIRFIIT